MTTTKDRKERETFLEGKLETLKQRIKTIKLELKSRGTK